MPDPIVDPDAPVEPPVTDPPLPGTTARKLDDLLSALDEADRDAVLGEVSKARKEAAGYRTRVKELEPLAAQTKALLDSQKTAEQLATEKALDSDLKAHGWRDRAVAAEVRALAANKFADPADAAHFLNLRDFISDDEEGDIDTAAIQSALDALLQQKPHLAVPTQSQGLRPDRTQGGGRPAPATPENELASIVGNLLRH